MSLTIIVTCNAPGRVRGFLGSAMTELAPGVYASPRLNRDTRQRIWNVLADWRNTLQRGSAVMVWAQADTAGGLGLQVIGESLRDMTDVDGLLLTKRALSSK